MDSLYTNVKFCKLLYSFKFPQIQNDGSINYVSYIGSGLGQFKNDYGEGAMIYHAYFPGNKSNIHIYYQAKTSWKGNPSNLSDLFKLETKNTFHWDLELSSLSPRIYKMLSKFEVATDSFQISTPFQEMYNVYTIYKKYKDYINNKVISFDCIDRVQKNPDLSVQWTKLKREFKLGKTTKRLTTFIDKVKPLCMKTKKR